MKDITIGGERHNVSNEKMKRIKDILEEGKRGPRSGHLGYTLKATDPGEIFALSSDIYANSYYKAGLWWETEAECQQFLNERSAINKIKEAVYEEFREWEPDWSDSSQKKYLIGYNHNSRDFRIDYWCELQHKPSMYFEPEKVCNWIIANYETELRIIWGIK